MWAQAADLKDLSNLENCTLCRSFANSVQRAIEKKISSSEVYREKMCNNATVHLSYLATTLAMTRDSPLLKLYFVQLLYFWQGRVIFDVHRFDSVYIV